MLDDDASPRGWPFHESFAAYHERASTRIPLDEDVFTVRTSSRPSRPSAAAAASARLDRIALTPLRHSPALPPPLPPLEAAPDPVRVTRRAMYDPVRDSASSRLSESTTHTRPVAQSPRPQYASDDEDRKPSLACQTCSIPHHGDCIPTDLWRPPHVYEGEDRTVIVRSSSRRQARDRLAAPEPAREAVALPRFTDEERAGLRLPPISTPDHDNSMVALEVRPKHPRGRHTWEHDRRSSSKRTVTELDGAQDRRSPPCSSPAQPQSFLEIKGKRKMMSSSSQSPAFRLDNILGPGSSDASRPPTSSAIGGYGQPSHEPLSSEPAYVRAPSIPVFTGKLPPTPFTGGSTLGSVAHTSISDFSGITVSTDVNLGKFAIPDDFERDILTSSDALGNPPSSQSGSFASGSRLPVAAPNAKAPRKLGATSQRRKSRGLFPNDDVPLVIASSTTKQSRYRPSGDRQPVACGYKDPITQVQCDEPFNRPVELRRHVRAVHVPAEALAVTMGQLSRSQATLLPNDWKPGDGDVLRPTCVCGKVFSRLDALRRHWTGVNAKVVDGKCIECPSSLAKKKDRYGSDHVLEQGSESIYGTPGYS